MGSFVATHEVRLLSRKRERLKSPRLDRFNRQPFA